jgi:hypothetical protein
MTQVSAFKERCRKEGEEEGIERKRERERIFSLTFLNSLVLACTTTGFNLSQKLIIGLYWPIDLSSSFSQSYTCHTNSVV